MQAILEKKKFEVINSLQVKLIITIQTRKNHKNNAITTKIIKQGVSTDFYINIIGEKNSQRSYETLCHVSLQVG